MKLKLIALFAFFSVTMVQAQHASFEASTGGFSFIPAFTSEDPHIIVNAGTTDTKRLSFHLLSTIRLENLNPRGVIFMSRYKFIDKKLKASFGIHLPAIQIDQNFNVDTFFAQEVLASYPLSKKWSMGLFYLHGEGRNNDFKTNFLALSTTLVEGNFSFLNMVLPHANSYQKLESIINERLQTKDNIVTKNFTHMVTNSLLYIDVLAFEYYLNQNTINLDFFKNLERKCLALIMFSLNVKKQKSEYDIMLLKMFENSLRYSKVSKVKSNEIIDVVFEGNRSALEGMYLYEIALITLISDGVVNENEQVFLSEFALKLGLNKLNQNTGYELVEFINKNNMSYINVR